MRLALILACALSASSCDSAPEAALEGKPNIKAIDPLPSVRRPLRRYYAINVRGRCSVFWIRPDARSITRVIRCPRELKPGERMRLNGHTCMRETADPARNVPARCPADLLLAERDDRRHSGEDQLPMQKPNATP